jgi:DNA-binding transcriptional MerR regulator
VLTLLREEFPDVTISKIRFLESQGLVNPERTPSGYRKFFEPDVERLRWVLRQQREHFLPLKVIKGRLEREGMEGDEDRSTGVVSPTRSVPSPTGSGGSSLLAPPVPSAAAGSASVGIGVAPPEDRQHLPGMAPGTRGADDERPVAGSAGRPAAPAAGARPTSAEDPPPVRSASVDPPSPRVGAADDEPSGDDADVPVSSTPAPGAPHRSEPGPGSRTLATGGSVPGAADARSSSGAPGLGASEGVRSLVGDIGAQPSSSDGTSSRRGAPAAASTRGAASRRTSRPEHPSGPTSAPGRGAADVPAGAVADEELTAEELAAVSGLSVEEVAAIESFGLICGRTVAGIVSYGPDARAVAQLAAGYAAFGVEARHLRFLKHAADREAGFIEQVVLPLLKQRNPDARRRAEDSVAELSRLGMGLRAALLAAALRDQMGG